MEAAILIILALLAILGVGGLIVAGVIWASRRAMQRQVAEMAAQASEGNSPDQQTKGSGGTGPWRPR